MRTLIVVLTWNRLKLTRSTLKSFLRLNGSDHEFLFVDNGSTDGTIRWLKKHNYEVMELKKNFGVFRATRKAWMLAHKRKYDYILNLQNDFPSINPIPWEDIYLLFETRKKIGFVQLNNKKYLLMQRGRRFKMKINNRRINKLTNKKIRGKNILCGKTKFFISNHHFSFNPNLFPAELVPHLVGKIEKPRERQIMEKFHQTGLRAARTRRRCFETLIRPRNRGWHR